MIKYRILTYIRNCSEHEEADYYKPARENDFWNNSYIEYKSKCDRKSLSVKIYLNKLDHI